MAVYLSLSSRDRNNSRCIRGRECAVITRELVGISRSDASIATTGVGGCLEARITCGNKITINIWTAADTKNETCTGGCRGDDNDTHGMRKTLKSRDSANQNQYKQSNRCVAVLPPNSEAWYSLSHAGA